MPSDISTKIAAAYFDGDANEMMVNGLAHHLDSMGVGDAFALCKTMPSDFCECGTCKFAKEALRKTGMV